jgi:S-adenosylhomocysteine hydrolase
LRERADVIYWDGEAIKKVEATMTGWFIEAMEQAKFTDFERDVVIRIYRDLAIVNGPQLRRETEK